MNKEERKTYNKKYRETHREQNKISSKKWHDAHKEEEKIINKKWRKMHPDKLKEIRKKYYINHKEILDEKARKYYNIIKIGNEKFKQEYFDYILKIYYEHQDWGWEKFGEELNINPKMAQEYIGLALMEECRKSETCPMKALLPEYEGKEK